jgi:hypothetical protein
MRVIWHDDGVYSAWRIRLDDRFITWFMRLKFPHTRPLDSSHIPLSSLLFVPGSLGRTNIPHSTRFVVPSKNTSLTSSSKNEFFDCFERAGSSKFQGRPEGRACRGSAEAEKYVDSCLVAPYRLSTVDRAH